MGSWYLVSGAQHTIVFSSFGGTDDPSPTISEMFPPVGNGLDRSAVTEKLNHQKNSNPNRKQIPKRIAVF
jgi:hypothetical protein